MTLFNLIQKKIQSSGPLAFVDFMNEALYGAYGYYQKNSTPFGANGDFITAPELSPLFGQTLAQQIGEIFAVLENPQILEFGAGSGRLCVEILSQLALQNQLPEQYFIIELSAALKQRQQQWIEEKIPQWASKITWLDAWPKTAFEGVVLANEVLDAMPVDRFLLHDENILRSHVILDDKHQLAEQFLPCHDDKLHQAIHRIRPKNLSVYQSEINTFIPDWIQSCAAMLDRGSLIIIDYGFPRHEYYHPDRLGGTLICHHRHRSHPNPLIHLGEQDITAHVDFTLVAESALASGFHVGGYTTQAFFLLNNGLLDLLSHYTDEAICIKRNQEVKILTHPHEMGELFKVIALNKGIDLLLRGFKSHDKRGSL